MSRSWIPFFTVIVCCMSQSANAAVMAFDSDADGIVSKTVGCAPSVCYGESYASTNPRAAIGYRFEGSIAGGRPVYTERTDKGYTVFDLSSLSETALSAKLQVDLRYTTDATSLLSVRAVDSAIAIALAANPVGTQSAEFTVFDPPPPQPLYIELLNQYLALSAGPQVGILEQDGPFSGVFEIELSSIALESINATDGLFALGLNWNSDQAGNFFFRGDSIAFSGATRLILNTVGAQVPTPATFWLVCAALLLLIRRPLQMSRISAKQ